MLHFARIICGVFFSLLFFLRLAAAEPTALPIEKSTVLIRRFIFKQHPEFPVTHQFPLKEFTTAEVWARLHVQIYKVRPDANALIGETYLLINSVVIPIGATQGDEGVNSLCVGDVLQNGFPQLFYTFTTRQGGRRSFLSIFSPFSIPVSNMTSNFFFNGPMRLHKVNDKKILLITGSPATVLGELIPEKRNGRSQIGVKLDPKLFSRNASKPKPPANKQDTKKSKQKENEKSQLQSFNSEVR